MRYILRMSAPAPSAQPPKNGKGPARVVGLVALVAGILAIVLIVLGIVGLARTATPNMQGFNPGAQVTVSSSGASVYARSDSDRMSTVCLLGEEGERTTLERPTSRFGVDVSGSEFFEVARVPESLTAGSYPLRCEGTDQALYVGPSAPSTSASGLLGPAGLIGGIVVAFFALALGLIALFMRTARSKGNDNTYNDGSGAAQPGYTSPYAPPPPPSWGTPRSEPTPAMSYGQGHFDPEPPPRAEHDTGVDQEPTGDESEDDRPEEPPRASYPPPPPPQ